ncbi:MAG: SdrD B-like domain-containing protein [Thiolinea sp.]
MKLYINGVLKGINAYTGGISTAQGAIRMAEPYVHIDEFYILDGQPTDTEVQALYSNLLADKNLDGSDRTCSCKQSYANNYCVAPSAATGLLELGDIPTSSVNGAGTYTYTDRVIPGYGTVDVTVDKTSGLHHADLMALDGGKQQSWLDALLPNVNSGRAIYMGPDSNGTITVTYDFDQPTGNIDLLVLDLDYDDAVSISARDATGAPITDFSGWYYAAGDMSIWQNPNPEDALPPAWNPTTATWTSTDTGNDHRSFGMLTPDTLVTQIVVTFNAPAVSGMHVYTTLFSRATDRDGQTSCPLSTSVSGKVWFDVNGDGIQNDGADAYIEGATVELYDPATSSIVATTTTNTAGEYDFSSSDGLQDSTSYQLRIYKLDNNAPVAGWAVASLYGGSDAALDSDASLSGNYWTINLSSPTAGVQTSGYGFGFTNTIATGCLDDGATGVSNESIANAHANNYDFEFNSQHVVGFCVERTEPDPQSGDNYTVNAMDRQSLTAIQREKIARSYSALTDPDIVFSIASAFGSSKNQQRLDDLLHYMTWYYTYYGEDLDAMSAAHLDTNSNYTPAQRVAMKALAGKVADRVNGANGETQYPVQDVFWLWNMTNSSRQDIVVPAIYAAGSSCTLNAEISGFVYTDSNANNAFDAASENGLGSITVNLLNDANGSSLASTSTAADGSYSFSGLNASLTYRVEVDTADPDLAAKTIGTTNPLTGVIVTAGGTTADQNFGFDATIPPAFADNPDDLDDDNDGILDVLECTGSAGSGSSGCQAATATSSGGSSSSSNTMSVSCSGGGL